ncbi:SMP-30/Gluconolaconase/LRE-like region [Lacunisphaera limnophila]|uniref:SMP-30/Gluconolaconase/LRE-like region n=1 Tax=Lacunisphaera limnophila TaxID=1838286 RepID=A0A1D8AXC6_9BACT|nr:tetratricopeptide repeat protein [Lacunisphaera limnophila]AOS45538.1 SMP-30/Gluconolaconase/LRE-like region [Lacunisphaera limnophila]
MRPSLLLLAAWLVLPPLSAAPRHRLLLRESAIAAQAGDNPTALAQLQEAAHLRPDYPRIQLNLARIHAAMNQPAEAIAALTRLADMGLQMTVATDPGLASLRDLPAFQAVAARLTAGPAVPPATATVALVLPDVTGIIESCLLDPVTRQWYFSDVRHRCIWRRDPGTDALTRFTSPEDALDGVFKIALSPDQSTLWAATATIGVMTGPDAEDGKRTALVAIDFATGRVRARHPAPADGRKHLLGDFVIAADGSLFATDSISPIIWRLPAGGTALEPWLESDDFLSLQGLAISSDGNTLYVADYANGIWRVPLATKSPALLLAPADATFFGIDGLYAVAGGLLAVQNGISPQRVLHIEPAVAAHSPARVLALGGPELTDLALGQVLAGRFHFVSGSGWALFDPPAATAPTERTVLIHSLALE